MATDRSQRDPPRLICDDFQAGKVVLDAGQSHYVKRVLRLQAGDKVWLYSGDGRMALAVVEQADSPRVTVQADTPTTQKTQRPRLCVALAVPKGDRADWAVEKLTEVGAEEIVWLRCERSVAMPKSSGAKAQRWRRVAEAAAKQSRRALTPNIVGPVALEEVLKREADQRFVAHPGGDAVSRALVGGTNSVLVLVGPEGGFTPEEMCAALQAGFVPVSLGPWVLRIETAAVVTAACLLTQADAANVGTNS